MHNIDPILAIDFYKTGHIKQYPKGTTEIYSNFTARSSKNFIFAFPDKKVVFFGLSYFIQGFLMDTWEKNFFFKNKKDVLRKYKRIMDNSLGKNSVSIDHIEKLHDLGYLPIKIKALPEGSVVPIGVPLLTIVNTKPEFFWITNYLETSLSASLWKPITVATIARQYRMIFENYANQTCDNYDHVDFQGHDFSCRGMSGLEDASICGAAHLTSFSGTDTILSIDLVKFYYSSKDAVGYSVPATEHSVMCMGSEKNEFKTFKRLITKTYPSGIVSIVSDTWDFWKVITEYLPKLKKEILNRNGKVVIRPDSGDPFDIICGNGSSVLDKKQTPESKGLIQCLWDIFGGSINKKGFKVLNPKIGAIYGDSISISKAKCILEELKNLGFASSNIVFGIGSYSYNYITRDTFSFALKSTSGVINGKRIDIFKDPKTDDGTKKSLKGLIRVEKIKGEFVVFDNQTEDQEEEGELKEIFREGVCYESPSFSEIKNRIKSSIK